MKLKSIKTSQWMFLCCVTALVLLGLLNQYFSRLQQAADQRYHHVLGLQHTFADLLAYERKVFEGIDGRAALVEERCQQLCAAIEEEPLLQGHDLLEQRKMFIKEHFNIKKENQKNYDDVWLMLPEIINRVRNIHDRHLDYLLKLGSLKTPALRRDMGADFQRGSAKGAPEIEIIDIADRIQSSLVEVFSTFYEMQKGDSRAEVNKRFNQRIENFYSLINRYEDYSLDAQDGILIEGLLLVGQRFKEAFSTLLKNEGRIQQLDSELNQNRNAVAGMFLHTLTELEQGNELLTARLGLFRNIALWVSALLAIWLVYYGLQITQAFRRTVRETGKIQEDLTYQIPYREDEISEFMVVFKALNSLAGTANEKVMALEKVQDELSLRVQERTAELVKMNKRLSSEIADRIKVDESRKELETRLIRAKKMEAVGAMAGGVAHDLNNILSGIVSYPDLILLDMEEDHPLYSSMLTIKNSGEKAAAIVQDLLTLARRGVPISGVVDIRQMIEEYLVSPEFKRLQYDHPDIVVHYEIASETGSVKGSLLHLQKTLMNLVANGMEAMPDGGTLTLSSGNTYIDKALKGYDSVQEGEYVLVQVADTGIGMSLEVSEQVFEPFFTQKKMGQSGTGLGMAVVWGTVKDHGGYIDIKSQPGKGTVISLYFPMTREGSNEKELEVDLQDIAGQNEYLLVVDDIHEQQEIAKHMLTRLGYRVETVGSGEEAVAYIKEHEVDLLVLDMIMPPGMDGLETYQAISQIRSGIRAVIASGYSETESVRKAQELGAGIYVKKPYSMRAIGKAVWHELHRE